MNGNSSAVNPSRSRPRRSKLSRLAIGALLSAGLISVSIISMPAADAATAPVSLGTSATYSVLGGSTVTNTGPSTLGGDLGLSPGSAITGFPPGLAAGATHAADAVSLQAQSDLVIAYDDAASRAPTASVAGDLVGQTHTAGVYKSTGPLALSGVLTLDGQGNPNAVFIFQVASTLITASASYVNVINGAQACNVFWQVASSATLGTHSVFRGTIMALTSVTVTTGTVVQGRALARNGAVTLDNDVFTTPACGAASGATATTTTVTTTPTSPVAGSTVKLTANVSTGGASPTGTVTFTSGGVTLGTATVNSAGQAVLTIAAGTVARTRTITAHFNGNINQSPSTSTPANLVVRAAAVTSTPVAGTPDTSVLLASTGPQYVGSLASMGGALLALGLLFLWAAGRRNRPMRQHAA
jgi:hypothetical protein